MIDGIAARTVRGSIRGKIVLITVLASAAALAVAGIGLAVYEVISIRAAASRNMTVLSKVLGSNCSAAAAFRDKSAAHDVLSAVSREPGVHSVAVYLSDGTLLSAYPDTIQTDATWKPTEGTTSLTVQGRRMTIVEPIYLDQETIGYIRLHGFMHELMPRLRQYASVMILVVLVAIAAAMVLTNKLQKGISGPLLHLAGVAAHVSDKGDYSIRADRTTDDEVGLLVSGFNTMLAEIERRDSALQHAHDSLEQRVLERTEELLKAKDAAEEAARAKTEFLANISHELRTPMHAILSFASFGIKKARSVGPEKIVDYFSKIDSAGSRLLDLLNDLLDLAKLEAGRMVMDFSLTDVNALMRNVVDEFRSLVSEREVLVRLRTSVDRPFLVDQSKIMQVVRNVLGNAVKFSPSGGTILVTAETTERGLLISIEDEGVGIPDDDIELVFGKFMQSAKTKTGAGGTGLGLAISREITAAHRGRIWAEPGRSTGALFWIEIPDLVRMAGSADEGGGRGGARCEELQGREVA